MTATREDIRTIEVYIDAGRTIGFGEGYQYRDTEVQAWLGVVRGVLKQPTMDELAKARELSHEPCSRKCRRCSRCIHSLSYWERGGADYLGGRVEW